jgi:hypothetical protein
MDDFWTSVWSNPQIIGLPAGIIGLVLFVINIINKAFSLSRAINLSDVSNLKAQVKALTEEVAALKELHEKEMDQAEKELREFRLKEADHIRDMALLEAKLIRLGLDVEEKNTVIEKE